MDQYYLPLTEKDRFILQIKDPTLSDFADFLTFIDTNKEVFVQRDRQFFLAVFNVKTGIFHFRYILNSKEEQEKGKKFMYCGSEHYAEPQPGQTEIDLLLP